METLLSGLQQEVNSQRAELEALRCSSLDLQRQRDLLRQQREDLEMQLARQRTEAQRGYRKPLHNKPLIKPSCFQAPKCLELRSTTHVVANDATRHLDETVNCFLGFNALKRDFFL